MTAPVTAAELPERISAALNRVCALLAVSFTLAMTGLVLMQVMLRYALDAAPWWTEEAARYCMIWAGLLGATVAFHDRMDLVLFSGDSGSPALRSVRSAARNAAALVFVVPLLVHTPAFIERHLHRTTDALGWNSALVVSIIPMFAAIIAFHALVAIWATARGRLRPAIPPVG